MLENVPSTSFQPLQKKQFPALTERVTSENRYWHKFKAPQIYDQVAPVSHIECCPTTTGPYSFAATSSTRIHLYSPETHSIGKTLSRFQDVVYSGSFRHDGKLVVAGLASGKINVMDVGSRSILRTFEGHQRACRTTKFASDPVHLFSTSDDKTARWWDLPSQKSLQVFTGHSDYVRTCASVSPDVWATGSYDHRLKMWDVRTSGASVLDVDHGAPVESCVVAPSGSLLYSAGGNQVKVWDLLAGGALLHEFSCHQKTITKIQLDSSGTRLLSASLDGHLKVVDLSSYEVTHNFQFEHGLVTFGLSADNAQLAVGTTKNQLIVRERANIHGAAKSSSFEDPKWQNHVRSGSYKYFVRGKDAKASAEDHVVTIQQQQSKNHHRLAAHDRALRRFEYKAALDAALETRSPVIIASMLEELQLRGGLERAIGSRDEAALEPLMSFLIKYVTHPRFSSLLVEITNLICDLYFPTLGQSMGIDELFMKLHRKVNEEIKLHRDMLGLVGIMDTLMAAQSSSRTIQS